MLRKATEEDMSALVALRCKAAGTNRARCRRLAAECGRA